MAPHTATAATHPNEAVRAHADQIKRLRDFQGRNADAAPAMVKRLQEAATGGSNVFAVLMDAVRVLSLGQIANALFDVGGQYRRSM